MSKSVDKIYVRLLDGAICWVPVNAKEIGYNKFQIIEDPEYTEVHHFHLFEFYPGDIVEISEQTISEDQLVNTAITLVKQGDWKDRKFNMFKFKATLGDLVIDKKTADFYRHELNRIKSESKSGQAFYPSLMETVELLSQL